MTKTKDYYSKSIEIPIFCCDLKMIIAKNLKKAFIEHEEWEHSATEGMEKAQGIHAYGEGENEVFWIAVEIDSLKASVISHEATHCTFKIFDVIGQSYPGEGSDEVFCYLQGWLVRQFMVFIKEVDLTKKFQFK